jgi:cation:H+ antiporter
MFTAAIGFVFGLAVLIGGAEGLVRGAASLARRLGIPALVVGLTVVAFGTSAPELVVNLFAAVRGTTDIAIGNIIGSNIANILLILGCAAAIQPLRVQSTTIWKEIPFALLAMTLVLVFGSDRALDGVAADALTRTDGIALIGLFIVFLSYVINLARRGGETIGGEKVQVYALGRSILLTIGGLVALFIGGRILVDAAVVLARLAGLSEAFIGLTVVAVGTSLPEFATSVVAAYRRQDDIAVGNIVGSNIFNVFWILGLTSIIRPLPLHAGARLDVLVGIIATMLLLLAMFVGRRRTIDRWQGVAFMLCYAAYLGFLIQRG